MNSYTLHEVLRHSTRDDMWMVIDDNVYDVTLFGALHPGGAEILVDSAGVDATEAFEDVAHLDNAYAMLKPYLVGRLCAEERRKAPKTDMPMRVVLLVAVALAGAVGVCVVQRRQWLQMGPL